MTVKHTLIRLLPPAASNWVAQNPRPAAAAALIAGTIAVAALSYLAGSRIKSPAQIAAEMSPPPASPILVPIDKRVLTSDIVTRGTARFALPQTISIPPSAAKLLETFITSLPLLSAEFREGEVAFTVSGRPVFVLEGDTPAFRDMTPGTSGEDVRQLERALKRLGFYPGVTDGKYDQQTAAAVKAWYTKSGWEPFEPTPEQMAEIHTISEQLAVAEKDQLAATLVGSSQLVEATRAKAVASNDAAKADVEAKTIAYQIIAEDVNSSSEARAKAEAELKAARSAVRTTRREGALTVLTAQNAQKVARREAAVSEALAQRLTADLQRLQSKTGVTVPANEVMFVSSLPARLEKIDATVGAAAHGPVLTVASNQVVIDSSLQLAEASLVKVDAEVTIDEADLGIKATGTVTKVADAPGTNGVDAFHVYMEVTVAQTPTKLAGTSLRITIPIKSTKGEVLAVPVSAVSLAADGTSRVQVQKNGSLEYVTVKTGLSAQGFVEVTAVKGALGEDQLVVVGFE